MSKKQESMEVTNHKRRVSLDIWAVSLAFAAALLIRFDIIRNVKW
jgi:hypothetical protein